MKILPAIDLKGGKVVRLLQGKADRETVYAEDPSRPAQAFLAAGLEWIHVVDLDGAFLGQPVNADAVRTILETGMRVEMGGGLRSIERIQEVLDWGVQRAVIGTRAAEDPDFLTAVLNEFDSDRIALGIDAMNGKVAVKGWVETLDLSALDLALDWKSKGGKYVIYTDISRDGMLTGPNFEAQETLCKQTGLEIIASGGVSAPGDLEQFATMKERVSNLYGVIVGKAYYDHKVSLEDMAHWNQ